VRDSKGGVFILLVRQVYSSLPYFRDIKVRPDGEVSLIEQGYQFPERIGGSLKPSAGYFRTGKMEKCSS
jgi:hypothetical protein